MLLSSLQSYHGSPLHHIKPLKALYQLPHLYPQPHFPSLLPTQPVHMWDLYPVPSLLLSAPHLHPFLPDLTILPQILHSNSSLSLPNLFTPFGLCYINVNMLVGLPNSSCVAFCGHTVVFSNVIKNHKNGLIDSPPMLDNNYLTVTLHFTLYNRLSLTAYH